MENQWQTENTWQPVQICSAEQLAKWHVRNLGLVTRYAGRIIRVRPCEEAEQELGTEHRSFLGCDSHLFLEVHPDDDLWPDEIPTALCHHYVLAD